MAGAIVSGTVDGDLPVLPDAQFNLLSSPGDLPGDLVLDRSAAAGDVIFTLVPVQLDHYLYTSIAQPQSLTSCAQSSHFAFGIAKRNA